jgi:hypothetical protein
MAKRTLDQRIRELQAKLDKEAKKQEARKKIEEGRKALKSLSGKK